MDVKKAFLNGFVEEEIYMDQLEGFSVVGEEQKVCDLQRSIYGLKQASRSWNIHFDEVIRGYDFVKNDFVLVYTRRKSSKQDTKVDSTTEAEYIAALEAAKEAVWMKNYIQELGVVPSIAEPVVVFCDNNWAIAQEKEPRSHHRSKHILRRYQLLREMVGRGHVRMDRVSSSENTADSLRKPLSQIAHAQHLGKMGLR
ncbi:UNVERIFIED_CONTAM: Retrovirus-related Pol polyprotein from transposon TNT 1-94 [Sesamum angustifolium]|uniref:Retrovirus-related Pol polyprotein from transposon TNT 1-94 n=1 Tax=Sesamum angustifolium TaxID=2727405 RepID=A0AAW2IZM1_9LAMI